MNVTGVLTAIGIIGGIGFLIGLFLGIASLIFRVEKEGMEEAVLGALPGNNCGGCGFPGCTGLASAIAKGEASVNACPVGGVRVGKIIAEIMGVEAGEPIRQTAFVACRGDSSKANIDYEYAGISDCAMQAFMPGGGAKSCGYGCLGYGSCVKVCQFDAIGIQNGIAVVDKEKCRACGMCMAACPKNLIAFIPYDAKHVVGCHSQDKGTAVAKVCATGCIGCKICKTNCPEKAITIEQFCAVIDQEKCTGCGICKEKCPKETIL